MHLKRSITIISELSLVALYTLIHTWDSQIEDRFERQTTQFIENILQDRWQNLQRVVGYDLSNDAFLRNRSHHSSSRTNHFGRGDKLRLQNSHIDIHTSRASLREGFIKGLKRGRR